MITILIFIISFLAIAGVIIKPFNIPEYIWAMAGAGILLIGGLLPLQWGLSGAAKGLDVYFFLIGMMILAEVAKQEGLFDWLAAHATKLAAGSAVKLFFLIYAVGTVVTIFLSNDATAVVLTPAVIAAMKAGKVKNPMPYLLICAFIANAASFVLPISNPANLVIYRNHMPDLLGWLSNFLIPSLISIVTTLAVLLMLQRRHLNQIISADLNIPVLQRGGKLAMAGIIFSALLLLFCSAFDFSLGLPTLIAGFITLMVTFFGAGTNLLSTAKKISWQVIPLVAGLFIIIEALGKTGLTSTIALFLNQYVHKDPIIAIWGSGIFTAFGCNLMNNLPAGLTAGDIISGAHPPEIIRRAILIGIDLGPNLSLSGSLATILWLVALRKENFNISGWSFLKIGIWVMTIPLLLVLASLFI